MKDNMNEESHISQQLSEVLRQLGNMREEVGDVREQVNATKGHPSQNGGWDGLMELVKKTNDHLEKIDQRLDVMEHTLNNPQEGAIAQVKELREWRERANATLDGNRMQDERLLRLELQLQIYNKVTWAIGFGVLGLLVKAFMSLIVPGA
jgi:hypothetical protein